MTARRSRMATYGWIERDGMVLLTKIAPDHDGAGQWTLPGGGIEWGEHPEEALHRELHEETGLRGSIEGFLGVDSVCHSPNEFNGYTEMHAMRLVYRVSASGNPQVTELAGSTIDAAWLPLDNVADLPIVPLVETARRMAEGGAAVPAVTSHPGTNGLV